MAKEFDETVDGKAGLNGHGPATGKGRGREREEVEDDEVEVGPLKKKAKNGVKVRAIRSLKLTRAMDYETDSLYLGSAEQTAGSGQVCRREQSTIDHNFSSSQCGVVCE